MTAPLRPAGKPIGRRRAGPASRPTGGSAALPAISRPRRFRSLASRLVALGLVQLVLLAITAGVIFVAEGPHEAADPEDKLTPVVLDQLENLVETPAALTAALDRLRTERIEISLYDETRQLIASNVDPPLAIPLPPRPPWRPPRDRGPGRPERGFDLHVRTPDSAGNAVVRTPAPTTSGSASGTAAPASDTAAPASGDPAGRGSSAAPPARLTDPDDRAPGAPPRAGDRTPDRAPPPDGDRPPDDAPPLGGEHGPPDGPPGFSTGAFGGPEMGFPDGPPGGPRGDRRLLRRNRLVLPFRPHGIRGTLVARGVHGEPPGLTGPLLVLGGGLAILVIGALITARWIVRPIERLSRTARALGSGDLAARSRLDRPDEIGELGHRFDEMADRIATLLATEKELLANVAHELRTPLTRIGVALDLANEGDAEAARASLVEIAVDVSELETIVDDILTAMRFEIAPGKAPAQLPLRRTTVPAGEIAAAAADRMRGRHPARPLEVNVAPGLPALHVDPVLFRRVIDNLLENAHKYTPDTGATIELAVRRDGDAVVYDVTDRGIGISAEDLPRIFTAFFRSERSRSRETGGVGLGLTLARRIVEAHGGSIDVTSTLNAGTTMHVRVPA